MSGQIGAQETKTQRLAAILARPVAAADRARAAGALADWAGCAIAGAASPVGRILLARGAQDAGPCCLIGGGRADPAGAAFAHGGLGNILEMDDVDNRAVLHPGTTVIPAALAAGQGANATGRALLDAIVRGYEAVIRIGRAVGPGHYRFFHNTATCGPFGAAAAVASVLGLEASATASALGLAGTTAGGLWRTRHEPQSLAKQIHAARAARDGLESADLAQRGVCGPLAILEGEQGFFQALCPDATPDAVDADVDAPWAIHAVSFKFWPACRHVHAAIDAAQALRAEIGPDLACARGFVVETYPAAVTFCDKPDPRTSLEAKFSFQHAVAVMVRRGALELDDFEPAAIADPATAALRARVAVMASPDYGARYPLAYGSGVRATLADGRLVRRDVACASGDPGTFSGDLRLEAKLAMLMQAGGRAPRDGALILQATRALDGAADLRAFSEALG